MHQTQGGLAQKKTQTCYHVTKTSAERKAIVQKMRTELGEVYAEALKDAKGMEKMLNVFSVGRSVALGQIFAADVSQLSDAQFVLECERVLVEDMGMDPQRASAMLADAAGQGAVRSLDLT